MRRAAQNRSSPVEAALVRFFGATAFFVATALFGATAFLAGFRPAAVRATGRVAGFFAADFFAVPFRAAFTALRAVFEARFAALRPPFFAAPPRDRLLPERVLVGGRPVRFAAFRLAIACPFVVVRLP